MNKFKSDLTALADVSLYCNTELIFCNVENIHVMRSSAMALADALAMQQNLHSSSKVRSAEARCSSLANSCLAMAGPARWGSIWVWGRLLLEAGRIRLVASHSTITAGGRLWRGKDSLRGQLSARALLGRMVSPVA